MPGRWEEKKLAPPVRVLLVSDTHGVVDPRIVQIAEECDVVVHAGDVGNGTVLKRLRPRHGKVYAVRGNNDTRAKWPMNEGAVLDRLPDCVTVELPGGRLLAIHGDRVQPAAMRHDRLRRLYPEVRAVVYGHTHRAVCDRGELPWILNPGAGGRVRTFSGPTCILLEAGIRGWSADLRRF